MSLTLCGAKSWGMVKSGKDTMNVRKLTVNPSCIEAVYIFPLEVEVG